MFRSTHRWLGAQNALDKVKFKCRVVSQQFHANEWRDFEIEDVYYSSRLPLADADALIVLYDPCEELLSFHGPKLWFTVEPSWHYHFHRHPIGKRLVRDLAVDERAFYSSPHAAYRIPHPTYERELSRPRVDRLRDAAVACVTNFGGRAWFLKRHFGLRNKFILSPLVELFGRPESWAKFRHFPQLWRRRAPANFRGKPTGLSDYDIEFIRFLSTCKVAVCLENCTEENYFTEKFVNAVRAGCIPVYHAHESVRREFLSGAKWVDPADFGFSPERTITFALAQSQNEYRIANDGWLRSGIIDETDNQKVLPKLHKMIASKLRREK